MCVHLSRKTIERQRHKLTTKKRDYENEGSSMHEDSCIGINYAHMFPQVFQVTSHIVGFRSVLHVFLFDYCRWNHLLNFDLYANPLLRFTLRNGFFEVVFKPPVGCSRPPSAVNDPTATK